jgi:hypothetical protein
MSRKIKKCRGCGRYHEPFEKRTEILGYHEGRPIVKAYPEQDTGFLTFWCDYCKREHLHGMGNGHRVAHCSSSSTTTPFHKTGYYLNEAA